MLRVARVISQHSPGRQTRHHFVRLQLVHALSRPCVSVVASGPCCCRHACRQPRLEDDDRERMDTLVCAGLSGLCIKYHNLFYFSN